ncbi:MAG: homoserine dehydrogenase [Candidatus Aminicenantes bacterium]|nr:homoserine dehydrogenase [Candidatus Aminicenantes bacterium]
MEYRIGLVGCGTVGQGLLEILLKKKESLREKLDFEAKVVAISDMLKGSLIIPEGIAIERLLRLLGQGKKIGDYLEGKPNDAERMDALEVIEKCDADIIAELTYTDIKTAEPATSHVKKALQTGKHVVTSNKGPAALFYEDLKKLAQENNLFFRIEGTVMSGTPVFNLFENSFAGNTIKQIKGILNGTTNFILTKMEEENMAYEDALKLAQNLGYAEADPTADVEGYDALAKIVILSNVLLGGNLSPSDAKREGITGLSKEKILEAKKKGYRYKLIASTRKENGGIEAGVSPQKLPLSDPLAGVMGANNALTFDLDLLGKVTIQGPGAGRTETGYSILIDMLAIHRQLSKQLIRR